MPHQSQYLHFWFEKYSFIYKYIHKGSCWSDRKVFIHHQVFLVLDSMTIVVNQTVKTLFSHKLCSTGERQTSEQ